MEKLEATVQQLTAEIGQYADNDPKRLEAMRESCFIAWQPTVDCPCGSNNI